MCGLNGEEINVGKCAVVCPSIAGDQFNAKGKTKKLLNFTICKSYCHIV